MAVMLNPNCSRYMYSLCFLRYHSPYMKRHLTANEKAYVVLQLIRSSLSNGFAAVLTAMFAVTLLSACSPPESTSTTAPTKVAELDLQVLPNQHWQLSSERIQLSFCRNRTNEALLAEAAELRLWRLSGEITAFPDYRAEGLAALGEIFAEHDVLLWQESGTVSSQLYRLASPQDAQTRSLFSAVARLNRASSICYVAVDGIS